MEGLWANSFKIDLLKGIVGQFLVSLVKEMLIPFRPYDGIIPLVIFLVVQLVYRRSLGLLPAMVCHIQSGLRVLTE